MAMEDGSMQWYFSRVRPASEVEVADADVISCIEFNNDGEFFAAGDKGGRIVIFQRDLEDASIDEEDSFNVSPEYKVYSTFQSHEPEFDSLKSVEIDEKINKIKWLQRGCYANFLLSTNDKTIKLWKITERDKKVDGFNLKDEHGFFRDPASINTLRIPTLNPMDLIVEANPKRVFANAHTYHINSISVNSDQETYVSVDDLRINLWHVEITDQSFNIVDVKPSNMEDLTEVITAAEFHPTECNLLAYSSSRGSIRLCDLRRNALCDKEAKLFDAPDDSSSRSFFSEIVASISDVKFSHGGRHIVTRDYLTVKVWDMAMENRPVEMFNVHEYLRTRLCKLYENDNIFDKFEVSWSGNDKYLLTGSYHNLFRILERNSQREVMFEASRENAILNTPVTSRRVGTSGGTFRTRSDRRDDISVDALNYKKKILHTAWHPTENFIVLATTNNLYMYNAVDQND